LLNVLILDKLVYELGYELNNRPAWLKIPVQAIIENLTENEGTE
jgi:maltose alpha-D-glucosyltransferase/alpha-amylase